jgi:hypothetical protein
MKHRYVVVILFALTNIVYADRKADKVFEEDLRKKYEKGLKKITENNLKQLRVALECAWKEDLTTFESCIKTRSKKQCSIHKDRAARREENLNILTDAEANPLNFAKKILNEIIINKKFPGEVPGVEDPDRAYYYYTLPPDPHHKTGGAAHCSRYETWIRTEKAIAEYLNNFINKTSRTLVPKKEKKDNFWAAEQAKRERLQEAERIKNILGIPKPKGRWATRWEKITSFFNQNQDGTYTHWVQQFIGKPSQP